jgi:serine/threonine protein kinase
MQVVGRDSASTAPPYEVGECLGGAVFRARAANGRAVALKTLRHLDARFAPQFKRAFETAARVRHPNLVELYEVNLTSSTFFYAMELVDGIDILRWLDHPGLARTSRGLHADLKRLQSVMRQLADGLNALHEAGLRHDNLKPRNVLVTPKGRVVITDYSLSVPLAQYGTIDSASSGNASSKYASPEQAGGGAITWASDWYAVGSILFEALTGRLAFPSKRLAASSEAALPSAVVEGVPPELDELCIRLLSREPSRRATYDDVMRAFDDDTVAGDPLDANLTHPRARHPPSKAPPIDFPGTERFVITRCLGHGGMGVVYEAFDRERNMRVALKTLLRCDPMTIYRFKQEFRALVDVSHPNLVAIYELVSTRGQWFFTMELLSGVDFVSYVRGRNEPDNARSVDSGSVISDPEMTRDARASTDNERRAPVHEPGAPIDWARLRAATRQLAQGLRALHESGHMHRDIKPSNVLVTTEGRVVLLDFGVIAELGPARVAGQRELVGTPIYMAPEQAHGKVTKASDWYSVGVMLYRVLTGATPYVGSTEQILFAKQELDPVSPDTFRSDLPPDLVALCMDLLIRDPDQRPSDADILSRLGSSPQSLSVNLTARRRDAMTPGTGTALAGREAHMHALHDTFMRATQGAGQTLLVHGSSGMGKSVLIDHFLHEVARDPRSIVLTGRCYEREQVPYKGVDAVVDALSRYLLSLPDDEAESLAPRDLFPLAKVFPVLESVPIFARADRLSAAPEPQELRRRAFAALRALLGRIATRGPLVVFIDDVQWGDRDSAPLLAQLMRPPDVPPLLLVLSYRTEDAPRSPLLESLLTIDGLLGPGAHTRELVVGPLPENQARELAKQLLEVPSSAEAAVTIARESGGLPYFIHELACHVNEEGFNEGAELSLDAVVARRVERLSEPARRMMEIVAVGGQPLTQMMIGQATVVDNQERVTLINQLRVAHLIRTTGVGDDDLVECYHDRIRELIVSQLSPERSVDSHRRIAIAMSDGQNPDPEALATHFYGARDAKRAFAYATRAADRAAAMLAFDRAAHFYRLALELRPPEDVARALTERLADALRNAGRGVEAAAAYRAAVAGAPVDHQLIYQRLAAEQLLYSGYYEEGLAAIEEVLSTVGLRLAKTPRRALVSLLWGRLRLRLRGLNYEPRAVSEIPPDQLQLIDTCYAVGTSLSLVDTVRASAFQALNLRLSLDSGELYRIARSLALEAGFLSSMGVKMAARAEQRLETAKELAHKIGNPHAIGVVILVSGICAYEAGRIAECRSYAETAEEVLRTQCSGVAWELACARLFSTWSSYRLGDIASLVQRVPVLEHEAEERGDLYSRLVMALGAPRIAMTLTTDRPDEHRRITEEARAVWPNTNGYQIQHYWADTALLNIDLYDDRAESAWERVTDVWPQIRRALLFRVDEITIYMSEMRARVALLMATRSRKRRKYLREVDRLAHVLASRPIVWCGAMASLLRAQVAALAEDEKLELSLLDKAQAGFAEAHLVPYEMVIRLRRGQLMGNYAAHLHAVRAWAQVQGLASLPKLVRMLAPVYATARPALPG